MSLYELTYGQTAYVLRLTGATESDIEKNLNNLKQNYEKIRRGEYPEQTYNGIPTMHWRSLILHDPMATLRKCPLTTGVLILSGAKDWQVPPREAIRIHNELKKLNHDNVELHIFSMLDHFLLEEEGVSRIENYFVKRRNTPPYVLQTISQWLERTCNP